MTEKRKRYGFFAKIKDMPKAERDAWYAQRRDKVRTIRANRREEVKEWKQETLRVLDSLVKEDLLQLDDPNYTPSQLTLWKIHNFLNQGFTFIDIRDHLLSSGTCSDIGWNKLKRLLFEKNLAMIEDLGLDIFNCQVRTRQAIEEEIKHLKKMRKRKPDEIKISSEIIKAQKQLMEIQTELAHFLKEAGVVGEKAKGRGNTINIFTAIPRPKPQEELQEPRDITPKAAEGA